MGNGKNELIMFNFKKIILYIVLILFGYKYLDASENSVLINRVSLANPSFEKEIKKGEEKIEEGTWRYFKKYSSQIFDSAIAHSGKGCLKISNPDKDDFVYTVISVKPEKFYRLTAWIKTEKVEGGATIFVYQKNKDGKVIQNKVMRPYVKGTTEWQKYEFCVKTEKDASIIGVRLKLEGKGVAYFDDIGIDEIEPVEGEVPNGSFEVEENNEKPLFWWGWSTGKPQKGKMYYIKDKDASHSGSHCVKMEVMEEKNNMILIPPKIKVEQNASYEISYWVKTGNFEGENDGVWLWIQGYENKDSKKALSPIVEKKQKIKNAPYWQKVEVKVLVRKGINYLLILPRIDGKGVAWIDDIKIKKME